MLTTCSIHILIIVSTLGSSKTQLSPLDQLTVSSRLEPPTSQFAEMKILFMVIGDYSPISGVGKTACSLAREIARDQDLTVIASGEYSGDPQEINFHRAPFWHPGKVWEYFIPLPVIWNFILGSWICRVYRKRFDVIHVFNGLVWSKSALITLQMCQKGAFRAAGGRSWRERLRRKTPKHLAILFLEWLVYRWGFFRRLVVCSRAERDEVIRYYGVNPEKITVIYNGIDPPDLSREEAAGLRRARRAESGYRESDRVCLFVGYDLKRKGLGAVLEALESLPGKYKLLVVGGRDTHGEFGQLIRRRDLKERVAFSGQHRDLTGFYAAADIFVLPTRYEPFGTAILEAMNWGLPVVTSETAGAAELITPGREGFLLDDPEFSGAIAALIRRIGEGGRAAEMAEAGRETARGCTWEKRGQELLDLYINLGSPK